VPFQKHSPSFSELTEALGLGSQQSC